jgi:hypothetical protein
MAPVRNVKSRALSLSPEISHCIESVRFQALLADLDRPNWSTVIYRNFGRDLARAGFCPLFKDSHSELCPRSGTSESSSG